MKKLNTKAFKIANLVMMVILLFGSFYSYFVSFGISFWHKISGWTAFFSKAPVMLALQLLLIAYVLFMLIKGKGNEKTIDLLSLLIYLIAIVIEVVTTTEYLNSYYYNYTINFGLLIYSLFAIVGIVFNGIAIIGDLKTPDKRNALFENIKSDCEETISSFSSKS